VYIGTVYICTVYIGTVYIPINVHAYMYCIFTFDVMYVYKEMFVSVTSCLYLLFVLTICI